jgi:hypothetical protein
MNRFTTRATVLALALLVAAGGTVFGDGHITTAISLGYGASYTIADQTLAHDPNFELKFSGDVGDYNSYSVSIKATDARAGTSMPLWLNSAKWTTNVGDALGMPDTAAITLNAGFFEPGSPGYGVVTTKGEEGATATGLGADYSLEAEISIDGGIGIEFGTDVAFENLMAGLAVDIDPVQAEVFYSVAGAERLSAGDGDLGVGLEAAMGLGDGITVSVGGEVNLDLSSAGTLDFGAGLKADLGAAALGVGVHASAGSLDVASIDLVVPDVVTDMIDLKAYVGLALAADKEIFDLLEFTAVITGNDAVTWTLGYIVENNGVVGDANSPGSPDGGFYVKASLGI